MMAWNAMAHSLALTISRFGPWFAFLSIVASGGAD